jgi:hypothetical protein
LIKFALSRSIFRQCLFCALALTWQAQWAWAQEKSEPILPLRLTPLPTNLRPEEESIAPLEIELPNKPSDIEKRVEGQTTQEPLKAQAQRNLLSGKARLLKDNPLNKYSGPRLNFIEVHIRNHGSEPVIIRGAEAQALTASGPVGAIQPNKLVQDNNHTGSKLDKIMVAAASAGTLGLVGPLTWEIVNPMEYRKRNLGCAVGRDAGRHEVEAEFLGRQVVLPQDETRAWLAFPAQAGSIKAINLPLLVPPFPNVSGNVTIPVK